MYLAGIGHEMDVKRLVLPLFGSPTSHITFSLCCLMQQSSEVFAEVHHFRLIETVL